MNQDTPQQKPAAPNAQAAEPAKPAGTKSTGGKWRIVVILIIVALFGWEALAFWGYQSSSQNIAQAMQRDGDKPTSVEQATDMIRGFPQRSSDEAYSRPTLTYRWRGLFLEYGGVRFSFDPETNIVETFEMGIPTREEEERMQMEYEPLPGDMTTAPRGDNPPAPSAPADSSGSDADPAEADAPPTETDETTPTEPNGSGVD
jgi:hypothetical protein